MDHLFGVQVSGFSPEASVFAHLLGSIPEGSLNARVMIHDQPEMREDIDKFARVARCDVLPFDTGWRLNTSGRKSSPGRLLVAARFMLKIAAMTRLAEDAKTDVVYSCQEHYSCRAATSIASRLNKPQVIHLHYPIGPWLKKATLTRLRTCEHVITVSDFIRDEALRHGVAPERVTTILNSMKPMPVATKTESDSVRLELGIPADAFVFCNVSRLDHGKGHEDMIAAFGQLAPDAPNAWLVAVGAGPLEGTVRSQAANTFGSDRILFPGYRRDVPRILGAANAFVHPSRLDACPLAILEAMGSGLPVIAYAEGGAKELVLDRATGYLAPAGDISELSRAMRELYENMDAAQGFGQAARARISTEFRPDRASEKFIEVLAGVCG